MNFALLSHLRWGAAWLVAIGHIRNLFLEDFEGGGLLSRIFYFATGFGHAGVVVFFVLSGFLVGRKVRGLARAPTPNWRGYLIDRFTRIFIVLWPAAALSLVALCIVAWISPTGQFMQIGNWSAALQYPLAGDFSIVRWVGLLALTNETLTTTPVIDSPLWSLAYEWTYYILAVAIVLIGRRIWSRGAWMVCIYGLALFAVCCVYKPAILLSGLTWVAGMTASIVSDRGWLRGRVALIASFGLAIGALIAWRIAPIPDLALGGAIALAISHRSIRSWSVGGAWGENLAGFSYSLYVTHFPICIIVLAVMSSRGMEQRLAFSMQGLWLLVATFTACLGIARLFAMATEDRTRAFKLMLSPDRFYGAHV